MKAWPVIAAALALAACQKKEEAPAAPALDNYGRATGRFLALGHFEPGRLWREVARAPGSRDPTAARPDDDEKVIAVVDSRTGEVRQCGNLSGACISFNPWMTPADALPQAPVQLRKHLSQAIEQDEAEPHGKVEGEFRIRRAP